MIAGYVVFGLAVLLAAFCVWQRKRLTVALRAFRMAWRAYGQPGRFVVEARGKVLVSHDDVNVAKDAFYMARKAGWQPRFKTDGIDRTPRG